MHSQLAQPWQAELARYQAAAADFTSRGDKIVQRYRDNRSDCGGARSDASRFNILWSNVRTLKPAIYTKPPDPSVSRRFSDNNPIARCAATILERALAYEITQFGDYHAALSNCVEDRLLPGRGVAWLRYQPVTEELTDALDFTGEAQEGENPAGQSAQNNALAGQSPLPLERIVFETSPVDYVYWKDFAHLPARTWEEVTWVARRVYLDLEEGVSRFGAVFNSVPLTHSPEDKQGVSSVAEALKKAEVWEIWLKPSKKVIWIARDFESILDECADPLGLPDFFPCPKPLYATISTGSLLPVADFVLYQDQAREMDELSARIRHLTRAMKVMGVYAADEEALGRLLKEGDDAVLIPVKNWPAFMEKGGLSRAVEFMPLGDLVGALAQLYRAREACKQIIYEVTGISDIMRGATDANETAAAQQIKSQFASIRLADMKDDVARFARELLRMKAAVMCSKYQPQTLIEASGIMNTPDAPYVEQALALLRDEPLRNFSIDIEDDTLVQLDKQADQQSRLAFLTTVGGFLDKAVALGRQVPEITPLLGDMLMFAVRGFKIGASIEANFDQALQQMQQAQAEKAQQPPQPTPEQLQMQAEQQKLQMEMQHEQGLEKMKAQMLMQQKQLDFQLQQQLQAAKMQAEQLKAEAEAQRENEIAQRQCRQAEAEAAAKQQSDKARLEFEAWKANLDNQTKLSMEQGRLELERWKTELAAMTELAIAANNVGEGRQPSEALADLQGSLRHGEQLRMIGNDSRSNLALLFAELNAPLFKALQGFSDAQQQSNQALLQAMTKPKTVLRDPSSGRITGLN